MDRFYFVINNFLIYFYFIIYINFFIHIYYLKHVVFIMLYKKNAIRMLYTPAALPPRGRDLGLASQSLAGR